jgi:Lysine methyltransferase
MLFHNSLTFPISSCYYRILELGSGTGVLGMTISKICFPKYNPTAIVLTDGDPMAVRLLKSNLENPKNQINTAIVQATHLLWEHNNVESMNFPVFSKWFRDAYTSECEIALFDSIFAGDVLYKAELPKLFFETAFSLLSKKIDSSLWLCHIPRHGVLHSKVVDAAKNAGFVVTTVDVTLGKKVEGCPLDDLSRAITYRMYINSALI